MLPQMDYNEEARKLWSRLCKLNKQIDRHKMQADRLVDGFIQSTLHISMDYIEEARKLWIRL